MYREGARPEGTRSRISNDSAREQQANPTPAYTMPTRPTARSTGCNSQHEPTTGSAMLMSQLARSGAGSWAMHTSWMMTRGRDRSYRQLLIARQAGRGLSGLPLGGDEFRFDAGEGLVEEPIVGSAF